MQDIQPEQRNIFVNTTWQAKIETCWEASSLFILTLAKSQSVDLSSCEPLDRPFVKPVLFRPTNVRTMASPPNHTTFLTQNQFRHTAISTAFCFLFLMCMCVCVVQCVKERCHILPRTLTSAPDISSASFVCCDQKKKKKKKKKKKPWNSFFCETNYHCLDCPEQQQELASCQGESHRPLSAARPKRLTAPIILYTYTCN